MVHCPPNSVSTRGRWYVVKSVLPAPLAEAFLVQTAISRGEFGPADKEGFAHQSPVFPHHLAVGLDPAPGLSAHRDRVGGGRSAAVVSNPAIRQELHSYLRSLWTSLPTGF
jgi:hypothetical protein